MRTTVRLDEELLSRAKREARRRGETLTSLLARGLRLVLSGGHKKARATRVELPISRAKGGLRPGVDLDDTKRVLDLVEGRE